MANWLRRRLGQAVFVAILLGAAAVRFPYLDRLPAGVNQDEASAAIEAWFLAHFGADRWGNAYPAYFLGWGSGQNALLSYLLAPLVGRFGLNIVVVRCVPALFGLLAVIATYLLARAQADRRSALLAAVLIAFAPWNVMASRWALESNLAPPLVALGLWGLQLALDAEGERAARWFYVAATFFAVSLYAYAAVLAPLAILVLLIAVLRHRWLWTHGRELIGPALLFLSLAAPFLLVLLKNYVVRGPLPFEAWLPFSLPLFENSRLAEIGGGGTARILAENAGFLLSGLRDGLPWSHPPGIAPLPLVALLLAAFGSFAKLREGKGDVSALLVCSVCATAPLIPMNVNRVNIVFIPLAALAGFGATRLFDMLEDKRIRQAFVAVLGLALLPPAAEFYQVYAGGDFNRSIAAPFRADLPEALRIANARPAQSGPILLDLPGGLIYALVLFHDPSSILAFIARTHQEGPFVRVQGEAFGRYYFSREKLQADGVRNFVVIERKDVPPCDVSSLVGQAGLMRVFECGSSRE